MPTPRKIERIDARITRDTMRELRRHARAQDTSLSRLVRRALESWIESNRHELPTPTATEASLEA